MILSSVVPLPSSVHLAKCHVQVFLHSLVTEQSLVSRTSEFDAAIENGDKTSLRGLCEKKSEETEYDILVIDMFIVALSDLTRQLSFALFLFTDFTDPKRRRRHGAC